MGAPPPRYRFFAIRAAGAVCMGFLVIWSFLPHKKIFGLTFRNDSEFAFACMIPIFTTLMIVHSTLLHRDSLCLYKNDLLKNVAIPIALYLVSIVVFIAVRIQFLYVMLNAISFHIIHTFTVFYWLYFSDEYVAKVCIYFTAAFVSGTGCLLVCLIIKERFLPTLLGSDCDLHF